MPWIRFEDNFPEHPKVLEVTDAAFRLHVRAVGYCSRLLTDGRLTLSALSSLKHGRWGLRLAAELVQAGLWEQGDDGYQIHDYLHYQPSKADVVAVREARSEAGRKGGLSGRAKPKQVA